MAALGVVSLVLSGFTLVILLIGLAIPYWQSNDTDGGTVTVTITTTTYSGLWQYCTDTKYETSNSDSCNNIFDSGTFHTAGLKGVQAMELIGLALIGAVVILWILKLVCIKDKKLFPKVIAIITLVAALFIILGPVIYATDVKKDYGFSVKDLHAGFALTTIASILCVVTGVISFFVP